MSLAVCAGVANWPHCTAPLVVAPRKGVWGGRALLERGRWVARGRGGCGADSGGTSGVELGAETGWMEWLNGGPTESGVAVVCRVSDEGVKELSLEDSLAERKR